MSTFTKSVFTALAYAGTLSAQSMGYVGKDASNSNMASYAVAPGESREPLSSGTISVRELRQPLAGKGLRILRNAKELLNRGEREKALEQLRVAMRDEAAEPYALAILGAEHLRVGDFDTAIRELQASVSLLPGQAPNYSNLAYALATRGRNEEALIEARKALQLDPGRPKTRYVLAQILMQMGRMSEAEFHLKFAAEDIAGARALLAKHFTPAGKER